MCWSCVLDMLRSGELYPLCNQKNRVFEAVNMTYCAMVIAFAKKYIEGKCIIVDINAINKEISSKVK